MTNEDIRKKFIFELEMGMFSKANNDNQYFFIIKHEPSIKWLRKLMKLLEDAGYEVTNLLHENDEWIKGNYGSYHNYLTTKKYILIDTNKKFFQCRDIVFTPCLKNEIPEYIGYYNHKL